MAKTPSGDVVVTAFTGPVAAMAALTLHFDLLLTPVKELDLAQVRVRVRVRVAVRVRVTASSPCPCHPPSQRLG